MAWKPWHQRVQELDTEAERVEFLRGVFGPPGNLNPKATAVATISGFLAGWSIAGAAKGKRRR